MVQKSDSYRRFIRIISCLLIIGSTLTASSYAQVPESHPSIYKFKIHLGSGAVFPTEDLKVHGKTGLALTAGIGIIERDFFESGLFVSYKNFNSKHAGYSGGPYDLPRSDFQITSIYGEIQIHPIRLGPVKPYLLMDAGISILSNIPSAVITGFDTELNRATFFMGWGPGFEVGLFHKVSLWISGKYIRSTFGGKFLENEIEAEFSHFTTEAGIKCALGG